jgi:hypothetical protein
MDYTGRIRLLLVYERLMICPLLSMFQPRDRVLADLSERGP